MAREIAFNQPRQRLFPSDRRGFRRALLEQRVREVLVVPGAAADHALELGMHHQVRQLQPFGGDLGPREALCQLNARQMLAARERALDDHAAFLDGLVVELSLAVIVSVERVHTRRGKCQHPPDVAGRHEVPGRPQDVRAQDVAVIERMLDIGVAQAPAAKPERPRSSRELPTW